MLKYIIILRVYIICDYGHLVEGTFVLNTINLILETGIFLIINKVQYTVV